MVGDDEGGRAVLAGERGVLGGENALEHERERALGTEPLEVAPGDARVDDGREAVVEVLDARRGLGRLGVGRSVGSVKPLRWSRSRGPASGRSTVRTSAPKPLSAASATSSLAKSRSRDQ